MRIHNAKRVVVLDLDDTLYLEREYVLSGFRAVGRWIQREFGVTGFDRYCWKQFIQGYRQRTFDAALEHFQLPSDPTLVASLVRCYRTHSPQIQLLPDARRLLQQLSGQGVPLALISDGPYASQLRKVQALQLRRAISPILLTDRWGRSFWKPHPRAFQWIQEHFGARPEHCVYIGDNPSKDFHAPRQLGWRTVHLRRCCALAASSQTSRLPAEHAIRRFDDSFVGWLLRN